MKAVRVPWSSASFLVYLGGLTILGAVGALLQAEARQHGSAGLVGWALLVFLVVPALALAARASGHRVTAGLLALSAVASLVVMRLSAPRVGRRRRDVVLPHRPVSDGDDWSAVLTLLIDLGLLAAAVAVDFADARPCGLWLHVVAGVTIGGGPLWFFHDGDWDWILVAIAGLVYVAVGDRLLRSSWVVLGAWGILQTAGHFAAKWSSDVLAITFTAFYLFPFLLAEAFDETGEGRADHPWAAALVFALTGALFVLIGSVIARRRREAVAGAELL